MRRRSDRWVKLAARGRFTFDAKARINNKDYLKISAPVIDRSLMTSPLSVGNCISATLNLSILTDDQINAKSPVVIWGRIFNEKTASEWMEFGTFFIDQRDTSFEGLVTVDCYDAMLKTKQSYLTGTDSPGNWPKTMKAVVEEVAYRIGVGIDERTVIRTGADYVVPYPTGKTMEQVLGYIGACHGGNWIITEENLLRLVPLTTAPDETFHVIDEDYEKIKTVDGHLLIYKDQQVFNAVLPAPVGDQPNSIIPRTYYITDEYGNRVVTPEGYYLVWDTEANAAHAVFPEGLINIPVVCGQITKGSALTISRVTMSGGEETYTAGDDTGATLTIEGNPYATQGICNDLYAAFHGLVYFPYTATKALYDPATELGDQVKIGDMVHSVMFGEKLTLDHNFRADIQAPNSEELSAEYPYLSEFKSLKQTAAELNEAIAAAASDLQEKVSDTDLQNEIDRASGVEQSLSSAIGAEQSRAEAAESALGGRVTALEQSSPASLAQRVGALETTVGGHTTSISDLNTAVSGHTSDISGLSGRVQTAEGNISSLQTASGSQASAISQAQTDIASLQSRVSALETTVGQHSTTLAAIQGTLSDIEDALIDIYDRLNALDGGGSGNSPEPTPGEGENE